MKRTRIETTPLPRGGLLLDSSLGAIQYGAVPETIKDTMDLPGGVPRIFIAPPRLFVPERGINLAELEFPAYWNFFIQHGRTRIVCRPDQQSVIGRVLSEAAFGPRSFDAREFARLKHLTATDLAREMAWFHRDAKTGRACTLDDLVEFVPFDDDGKADLGEGVVVARSDDGGVAVIEGGRLRAAASGEPPLPPPRSGDGRRRLPFRPPVLGVTVIGSGHGFDPGNRTSGFILWVDGRGVMVDPPVDALDWLAGYDVDPRQIDSLILTHCHADHDAGTLQKLLQEGRITIYTTPTVLSSFVAKNAHLIGMEPTAFRGLFDHVPVHAGEPISIHGAMVTFRYSLHSIPCVGFEAALRGHSLVYPSDTLNDPRVVRKLRDTGIVNQDRARELLEFPWHHQLVLHEAGVPPIHTPVQYLAGLDEAVKSRMLLVHVSERTLPSGSGLRVAPTGLENTVDMGVSRLPVDESVSILDAFFKVDLFSELPVSRAAELLRCVRKETFKAGERVVARGTTGDRFFVILSGHAVVRRGGKDLRAYADFDYFGETALVTGKPRVADVDARTDLTVLALDKADFFHILRGTDIARRLVRLAVLRETAAWELLSAAPGLAHLSTNQKTRLLTMMESVDLPAGSVLGRDPVLVAVGRVRVTRRGLRLADVTRAGLALDVRSVRSGRPPSMEFQCLTRVRGYRVKAGELRAFLRKNPGLYVRLSAVDPAPSASPSPRPERPRHEPRSGARTLGL